MQRHDVALTLMRRCINAIYFIVCDEISVYLVKIKVVSVTSELISAGFVLESTYILVL